MNVRLRWGIAALSVLLASAALVSCSSRHSTQQTGRLTWQECGGIQCTSLSVPLDWSHPDGQHIQLRLARRPAGGNRIGVLLANPGGPGGSGVEFLREAGGSFGKSVRDRFDIVSWDPRGVGDSAPADCGPRLDYFYELDRRGSDAATAKANAAVAKRLVEACRTSNAGQLPYLSTRATVRDMDAIRAAMGVPTIDYLGFSYGTYIGALYADQFPKRVRTMVLDGAIDPAATYGDAVVEQSVGFERALDAFLEWCDKDRNCDFARDGNPKTAFDKLMHALAGETDPGTVGGEQRDLGIGEANIAVAAALYGGEGRAGWIALGTALNDAARGDGSALLELSDSYTGRQVGGTYDNQTAAFYSTSCLDGPAPRTIEAVERLAARAEQAAPHFGAESAWLGLPCTFWPARADGRPGPIRAAGAPPILVIGNTDDPATPYSQAQALARELQSARLLTFVGEGHTSYGRGSSCVDDAVDRYLVSRDLPPAGKRCG